MRKSRRLIGVIAALIAATAVVGFATGAPANATVTTQWIAKSFCPTPKSGHMACQAMHLVKIKVTGASANAAGVERPDVTGGPAGGYTPAELAKAYGMNAAATTTQTVAIVDAFDDPTVLSDLNTFDANYGLPAETSTSFKVLNQTGAASPLPTSNAGWAGEITLDTQAVRGMCQKCKIILIEANSNSDADLGASENEAVALGAKIVSNSFGGPEDDPSAVAADYNHSGVAIIASTGDHGWYSWDEMNASIASTNEPNAPAAYKTVIAVGGTSLYLNADSTRADETVWNTNGPGDIIGNTIGHPLGASGGGCSFINTPMAWQLDVSGYSSLGCGTFRSSTDIAADADPFTGFDTFETFPNATGAWNTIGGTSLAAPLVAAMWGLAGGPGAIHYPSLSLYGHFKGDTTKHSYDVRAGGNGFCDTATINGCLNDAGGSPNEIGAGLVDCAFGASTTAVLANHSQCYAAVGYDGVSGVGTPAGATLFVPDAPTAKIAAPGTVTHNVTHTFSASGSSDPFPGGTIVKYVWNWGDGTSTTTTSLTTSHKYAAASSGRTITLTVTDNYASQGVKSTAITLKIVVH